jgi:hypothetical protein
VIPRKACGEHSVRTCNADVPRALVGQLQFESSLARGISQNPERVCAKSIGASLSRSTRFGLQAGHGVALDGLLPLRPETCLGRDRIGTSRVASAEIQAGNRSGPLRPMWRKVKRRVALPWGVGVRGLCCGRSVPGGQRECSTLATTRAGDPKRP